MSNVPTIHNARDYVNYVFNISARGVSEVTSEIFGLSSTVQNVLGNLAFKTSEYLSHGESAIISFGAAAAGAYIGATKRAIEFQQATANVEAISGKQLVGSEVGAKAMEMSNKFGMAIEDMTTGLEALARAGITAQSSVTALLESGTQMAKFEGTDLESSMNDLIATVNLLTPELDTNSEEYAQRVEEINQHIISTSESSPINAQNIINSLQHVGGYASSTNLDQDDLFAVIAQMGSKGTKGEITGTSLRAFVSAGQKDTAQRALKRIGLNVSDLWNEDGESILSISKMKDVLDTALESKGYSKQQKLEFYSDFVGYKQANQIMKINTKEVEHYRKAIDDAMSVTDKMGIVLGTVQGNWAQIRNTAINFMTKVGSKLLPIINAILIPVKMIVGFIDKVPFADWAVAGGLLLLTTEGIAKGIQVLIPTLMTFVYKIEGLNKDNLSIRNLFKTWKNDLEGARDILFQMTNKEKMNEIVNLREDIETNKYLKQLNERDAINEILKQKFGMQYNSDTNKYEWVWNRMSETEREHFRNLKRPPDELINKMIEKRREAFTRHWDEATARGHAGFSSNPDEWPNIDDIGGENYSHGYDDAFKDDIAIDTAKISQNIEKIYNYISGIDIDDNRNTHGKSVSNISYRRSNRERNDDIQTLKEKVKISKIRSSPYVIKDYAPEVIDNAIDSIKVTPSVKGKTKSTQEIIQFLQKIRDEKEKSSESYSHSNLKNIQTSARQKVINIEQANELKANMNQLDEITKDLNKISKRKINQLRENMSDSIYQLGISSTPDYEQEVKLRDKTRATQFSGPEKAAYFLYKNSHSKRMRKIIAESDVAPRRADKDRIIVNSVDNQDDYDSEIRGRTVEMNDVVAANAVAKAFLKSPTISSPTIIFRVGDYESPGHGVGAFKGPVSTSFTGRNIDTGEFGDEYNDPHAIIMYAPKGTSALTDAMFKKDYGLINGDMYDESEATLGPRQNFVEIESPINNVMSGLPVVAVGLIPSTTAEQLTNKKYDILHTPPTPMPEDVRYRGKQNRYDGKDWDIDDIIEEANSYLDQETASKGNPAKLKSYADNIRNNFEDVKDNYEELARVDIADNIPGYNKEGKKFFDNIWGKKEFNYVMNDILRRRVQDMDTVEKFHNPEMSSVLTFLKDYPDIRTIGDLSTRLGDAMWDSGAGLSRPSILHRQGQLNTSDTGIGVLTGITSTALDSDYADMYATNDNQKIKIYAPTGTLGFDTDGAYEHTLPPNYPYIELKNTYREAEILLLTLKQIHQLGFNPRGLDTIPYRTSIEGALSRIDDIYDYSFETPVGMHFKQAYGAIGSQGSARVVNLGDEEGRNYYFGEKDYETMPISNPKEWLLKTKPNSFFIQDANFGSVKEFYADVDDRINAEIDEANIRVPNLDNNTILSDFMPKGTFNEKRGEENYSHAHNQTGEENHARARNEDIFHREHHPTRNKTIFDLLKGSIKQEHFADLSNHQLFKARRAHKYSDSYIETPLTADDVIQNLQDFYQYGKLQIYEDMTDLGTSNSALGRIRLNPKQIYYENSQHFAEELFNTYIHELSHATLNINRTKGRSISTPGKVLNDLTQKHKHEVYGYSKDANYGTEAEANNIELTVAKMLGFGDIALPYQKRRAQAFLAELNPTEDINLDLMNSFINEMVNNPEEVMAPVLEKMLNFNSNYAHFSGKEPELRDNFRTLLDSLATGKELLATYNEEGVSFDGIFTSNNENFAQNAQNEGSRYANQTADIFDLAPIIAAKRIKEEQERIQRKMEEWRQGGRTIYNSETGTFEQESSVMLNAYKKNLKTSAMTQEGKKFAIEKNQRQLFDFLNNGFINSGGYSGNNIQRYVKGGLLRGQWEEIQNRFAHAQYYTDDNVHYDDKLLQEFGNLNPAQFIVKYQSLTRDADKLRVKNALLEYGEETASMLIDTRENVNNTRKELIKAADYKLIDDEFHIGLEGNRDENYEALRHWIGNSQERLNSVAELLMKEHEAPLARTIETNTTEQNKELLEALKQRGYDMDDIISEYERDKGKYNLYRKIRETFYEVDSNGNYLADNQQQILKDAEEILGGWAEFGRVAQYELSLHFEEINKLAARARINVNNINGSGVHFNGEDIPDNEGTTGTGGGTGTGGSSGTGSGTDTGGETSTEEEPNPAVEAIKNRLLAWQARFKDKMKNIHKRIFGEYEDIYNTDPITYMGQVIAPSGTVVTDTKYNAGNRFVGKAYEKLKPYENVFGSFVGLTASHMDNFIGTLRHWQQALMEVGDVFPPFTAAAMALSGVIAGLTVVTNTLITVEKALAAMRNLSGALSVLKGTAAGNTIKLFGETITNALGMVVEKVAIALTTKILPFITAFAAPLAAIAAVIIAITAALKLSQDSHDKYLEKLKTENKEVKAQDKANQAAFKNLKQQRRYRFGQTRTSRSSIERRYEIAEKRLEASQKKRFANVMKIAEQENDMLWGTYGERAQIQKMGWAESIMAYGIPFVGTIAKALAGEFKSTASEYAGTSEQIRNIKEYTVSKQPWQLTAAQRRAAAYYDAHQPAFAMMDDYKSELGELYDKETKFIRMYGSKEAARNNSRFQKAVNEFVEATGINKETALNMLDYMQTEHVVEQATKAMQAEVDSITSTTELQALAIANGASPEDLMNPNDENARKLMIEAQADMIKQEAADSLWWKGNWKMLEQFFFTLISPITLIANMLGVIFWTVSAIFHWLQHPVTSTLGMNDEFNDDLANIQSSGENAIGSIRDMTFVGGKSYQQGLAYYSGSNKIRHTDLAAEGNKNADDEMDRADYGSGGKVSMPATGVRIARSNTNVQNYNGISTSNNTTANSQSQIALAGSVSTPVYSVGYENTNYGNIESIHDSVKDISRATSKNERTLQNIDSGQGIFGRMKNHALFKKGPDLVDLLLSKHKKGVQDEEVSTSDIIKGLLFNSGRTVKAIQSVTSPGTSQGILEIIDDITSKIGDIKKMSTIYKGFKVDGYIRDSKDAITKAYKAIRHPIKTLFGSKVQVVDPVTKEISTVREGGLINKIRNADVLKNAQKLTQNGGEAEKFIDKTKRILQNSEGYKNLSKRIAESREINAWAKNSDLPITTSNFDNMVQILDDTKLAYAEKGLSGALKASSKALSTKNIVNIGKWGWDTSKAGIIEGLNPKIAYQGFKEIGGGTKVLGSGIKSGLKGGGWAAAKTGAKAVGKGVFKSVPIIGSIVGGAITLGEEVAEHDPSKVHYNEDGTEKRAFQSTGEVVGSTGGSIAGALAGGAIGAKIGAAAGATLGSAVPGIGTGIGAAAGTVIGGFVGTLVGEETMRRWGDELGSAIGWVADETINNPAFKSGEFFHSTLPVMLADGVSQGAKMLFGDNNPVSDFILNMEEQGGQYWQWIQEQAGGVFTNLMTWLGDAGAWLSGAAGNTWNWINEHTGGIPGKIVDGLVGGLGGIYNWLTGQGGDDQQNQQQNQQQNGMQSQNNLQKTTKKREPGYFAKHTGFTSMSSGQDSLGAPIHARIMDAISNGNTTNLTDYQSSSSSFPGISRSGSGNKTNLTNSTSSNKIKSALSKDSSSMVIENININTDDDPEKIKTALMNLVIELQEQVSPRLVSRTIGEPPSTSADIEEDTNLQEDENGENQTNNTTNNNPIS